VGVHSVLRESLGFGDISVHGLGRMDNLLKVHKLEHDPEKWVRFSEKIMLHQ